MRRLTLVRHGKSSWAEPYSGDFDRPLNGRGKRDARLMGERLASRGARPDVIVASPARRARKTARIIAGALGYGKKKIREEPPIYEADVGTLIDIIHHLGGRARHAILVGHNPGFTDLAEDLTGERLGNVPTCGVVTIEYDVDSWGKVSRGRGRLVYFDFPKRVENEPAP